MKTEFFVLLLPFVLARRLPKSLGHIAIGGVDAVAVNDVEKRCILFMIRVCFGYAKYRKLGLRKDKIADKKFAVLLFFEENQFGCATSLYIFKNIMT